MEPPSPTKQREKDGPAGGGSLGSEGPPEVPTRTMPPCLTLLLLAGLAACAVAADEKLALGGTEAGPLVTVNLEVTWGKAGGDRW